MKTLVTIKAKKPRKAYKSDEAYLRAVYRNNKQWLDKVATYKPKVKMETSFVNSAMDYVKQGYTARQAANKLASSAAFAGKSYRGKVNIYNVIMNDKKLYAKFKEESSLRKKADFDIDKLQWRYDLDAYVYEDVIIDVSQSPYRVTIRRKGKGLERVED